MTTALVWRTNAFGEFRVTVEKLSVNGMATLIKFTRGERYRPAEAGSDGTMWVASSTLHKVSPKAGTNKAAQAAFETRRRNAGEVAKRTAETLAGKMLDKAPEPTKRTAKRAPAKGLARKATGTVKRQAPKGSASPKFQSF